MFWKIVQYWNRRQAKRHWILFVLVLLGVTAILASFNGIGQLDRLLIDTTATFDRRSPSSDIVIVTIDDDSIRAFNQHWPWPRSRHAELLEELSARGAYAVGLDIIMTESSDPQEDAALALAMQSGVPIILPISVYPSSGAGGWMDVKEPIPELLENAAALAHINMDPDSDGVVRSVYLREGRDGVGGGVWYHLAVELWRLGLESQNILNAANKESWYDLLGGVRAPSDILETFDSVDENGVDVSVISDEWLRDRWMLIPYAGPVGTFPYYSYFDVLYGAVPEDAFQGKYVLVGATALGMLGDGYSTPMVDKDALMPGVEIIANILDGLIQNEYRYLATPLENIIFNVCVVALIIPLFYLGRPRVVLLSSIGLMVISLFMAFIVRRYVGVQVAPAASLITLSLAYPFWSWRRLDQAMYQIFMEFSRMRRENGFFQAVQHVTGDRLERELQAFESAAWQLRERQQMLRQGWDVLPYIMLLTDEHTQVILSNMQARQFFKIDPPLPTMAFEPAMGAGATEDSGPQAVPEHYLSHLLAPRFLEDLQVLQNTNSYARTLIQFLKNSDMPLTEGAIEVTDSEKGENYLLKIVPRTSTIERSRGWIVTLVNLNGVLKVEMQRDQILRYLQDDVSSKLLVLQENLMTNPEAKVQAEAVDLLREQLMQFLSFQYAQSAIYFYEQIDLCQILEEAYDGAVAENSDQLRVHEQCVLPQSPIYIRGDSQILTNTLMDLMSLMLKISAHDKMPQVKLVERIVGEGGVQRIQIFMMIALKDLQLAKLKNAIFTQEIAYSALDSHADPDLLSWWAISTAIHKHSGTIKIQHSAHSLGVMIEF